MRKIRSVAIYLPQFHPIPENDEAWGEGFTEWTNVKKAKPLYKGHYQPQIPHKEIGYYDLSEPDTLVRQATMAREHGIYGFAFYHYWFNGKLLLDTPLNYMLNSHKPDFPFCYIWANENWTRRWDGEDNEIIIKQDYSFDDDRKHIIYLCENVFNDERYITIDNKPFFIVYKPYLFPNIKSTLSIWRQEIAKTKFREIYIATMDNFLMGQNYGELGFDATIHFQPDFRIFSNRLKGNTMVRIMNRLKIKESPYRLNRIYDYEEYSKTAVSYYSGLNHKCFPGIMPGWDNTPRRRTDALIFKDSSPDKFKNWLISILKNYNGFNEQENFLFINAWNEWAEGNHIEPCEKYGDLYLKTIKELLTGRQSKQ